MVVLLTSCNNVLSETGNSMENPDAMFMAALENPEYFEPALKEMQKNIDLISDKIWNRISLITILFWINSYNIQTLYEKHSLEWLNIALLASSSIISCRELVCILSDSLEKFKQDAQLKEIRDKIKEMQHTKHLIKN